MIVVIKTPAFCAAQVNVASCAVMSSNFSDLGTVVAYNTVTLFPITWTVFYTIWNYGLKRRSAMSNKVLPFSHLCGLSIWCVLERIHYIYCFESFQLSEMIHYIYYFRGLSFPKKIALDGIFVFTLYIAVFQVYI